MEGVHVLNGCEVNITDYAGGLDLPDELLDSLDWVIASMHIQVLPPASRARHTEGWLAVAQNPLVDVIGHCGNPAYAFDFEAGVRAFAKGGKIVEINSHSLGSRAGSEQNCEAIARLCKQYEVPVVISTDAHCDTEIGNWGPCIEMLSRIGFPEKQILNTDKKRFAALLKEKTGRAFEV